MFQRRAKSLLRNYSNEISEKKIDNTDYEILDRQMQVWDVLSHSDTILNTKLKLLAVVIFNNKHNELDVVEAKRIEKLLSPLAEHLQIESLHSIPLDTLINDTELHNRIAQFLKTELEKTPIQLCDTIELAKKAIDLESYEKEINMFYKSVRKTVCVVNELKRLPTERLVKANIHEFQRLFFGNQILYTYNIIPYYENSDANSSFSSYLYYNCLNILNVSSANEIVWQKLVPKSREYMFAVVASSILRMQFNDKMVMELFYSNHELIPMYNVADIIPLEKHMQDLVVDKNQFIDYWNNLSFISSDGKTTKLTISPKYQEIFKTFPFKDSHLIQNNEAIYLNVPSLTVPTEYIETLMSLCTFDNLETYIHDLLQYITPNDIFNYAVKSTDLKRLGYALILLRIYYGPVYIYAVPNTTVKYNIPLPTMNDILQWLDYNENTNCHASLKIIFPCAITDSQFAEKIKRSEQYARCKLLIETIVKLSDTPTSASVLSSAFCIPEVYFQFLYNHYHDEAVLTTTSNPQYKDNHLYVLLTIIMQQYNFSYFYVKRQSLLTHFTKNIHMDVNKDLMSIFAEEFKAYPQIVKPNIRLNRIISSVSSALPTKLPSMPTLAGSKDRLLCYNEVQNNFQKYKFSDKRLDDLVKNKTEINLKNSELARLLYILLKNKIY